MVYFTGKDGKTYPKIVTDRWLRQHPEVIFVFGDNTIRRGKGGAAKVRDEPNTFGVITKKYPNNNDSSFFRPDKEFMRIFAAELVRLIVTIWQHPEKTFLVAPIASQLANRYGIYEQIVKPALDLNLAPLSNVVLIPRC